MNKDDCAVFGQHQIWGSRKLAIVKAVTETARKQRATQPQLRTCIFTPDASHYGAARRLVDGISHAQ
jgi:hypothetical protein